MYLEYVAAASGSFTSALRYVRVDKLRFVRTILTGFALSVFVAPDVVLALSVALGITISKLAALYVLAYLGSSILERALTVIDSLTVSSKWLK